MHFSTLLLLPVLSALVAAEQAPLADKAAAWFDQAKSYLPYAAPVNAAPPAALDPRVERINLRNWQRKLSPKLDTEEEWLVYVTGGNKSCFGRCGKVDSKWTEAIPLLAALPQTPSVPLHLGLLDCEKDEVLCTGWATTLPSVYHFNVPKKSEPQAPVPLHIVVLNFTTTTPADIVSIANAGKARYLDYPEYTGAVHPFDGWLAKFGLLVPWGYLMWGFGNTPNWVMMIGISFVSRRLMNRRMNDRPGFPTEGAGAGAGAGAAAAAPAPPRQAQTPNRPAPAAPKSGGKKRR